MLLPNHCCLNTCKCSYRLGADNTTAVSHFGTDTDLSDVNSHDADLPLEHYQCVQELQESMMTSRSELSALFLKTS